jgi:uncharacterized protein YdhG (YjbR/CyaY superfamily)
MTDQPETIDAYIRAFPEDVRKLLQTLRETIKSEAPDAEEAIKYRMPAFVHHGNLVFFAAFKRHIGLYPFPSSMRRFRDELSAYKTAKGSIRFPFDRPLPLPLIRKIVRFRIAENRESTRKK